MTLVVGLLVGMLIGFGLGWISKPKYAPDMSRHGQILLVAGSTFVAALVIGWGLGERGWTLIGLAVLLPLVFLAPYAGGEVRARVRGR